MKDRVSWVVKGVLSPVNCQPDRRVSSVRHDIAGALKSGENDGPSGSY